MLNLSLVIDIFDIVFDDVTRQTLDIYETEVFRCIMLMLAFCYGNKTSFGGDERIAVQHNYCLIVLALCIVWHLVKSVMRSIRTVISKQQLVFKALHLTILFSFLLL